ncbi:MAG TPA: serine protease [Thermoanaerobaculia bacterium]
MSEAELPAKLQELLRQRAKAASDVELLDERIRFVNASICVARAEFQDVEKYEGGLGVSEALVDATEPKVGQLQWLSNLAPLFPAPDTPGTVAGQDWGTGALISRHLFLTAGHCFDQDGQFWTRPERNGKPISPAEVAILMHVKFNFQVNGATDVLRPGESFPVVQLREHRDGGVDYAIIELGPNAAGQLPGDIYGWLPIAPVDAKTPGTTLCIIQHPGSDGKKIEAGTLLNNIDGTLSYNNIDTLPISSGAPILNDNGEIVGVHVSGGCYVNGWGLPNQGANLGEAIGRIRDASQLI